MPRSRRALLRATAVAALFAAPGCGGTDEDVRAALTRAADAAARFDSARLAFDFETRGGGADTRFVGEGTATSDNSRGRLRGRYREGRAPATPIEVILAEGGVTYTRSPDLDEVLPPGKRWLRTQGPASAPSTITTAEFLEFLRADGEVEQVGTETVRGRPATRYRTRVDMRALLQRSPPEAQRRLRGLAQRLPELLLEVWIAGDLPVRYGVDVPTTEQGRVRFVADVLAWGVPIDAGAPPARTVVDERALGG